MMAKRQFNTVFAVRIAKRAVLIGWNGNEVADEYFDGNRRRQIVLNIKAFFKGLPL